MPRDNAVRRFTEEFLALQEALAGQYSLERELGRGGMGIVYLAREVALDRQVALKVLPAERALDAGLRERFLREARTAARLSHPHIVPIHRVDQSGAWTWFAMSYVEGQTLAERVRDKGPLPVRDATRLLREVAWALAYAHARGIVHRDVKPENILIEAHTGRALVTDFGIAQLDRDTGDAGTGVPPAGDPFARPRSLDDALASIDLAPAGRITGAGRVLGTAHYMSPEQASGLPLDGRSDLYALGALAHFAVSGRVPFDGTSTNAIMLKHVSEAAPSLAARAPGVPRSLALAVDKCLQKDANARFGSVEAFADALGDESQALARVPAAVRVWMADQSWLGYVDFFFVLSAFVSLLERGGPSGLFAALLATPFAVHLGARLIRTRRLFTDGFTLADIRRALREKLDERAEELAYAERRPRLVDRIVKVFTGVAAGVLAVGVVVSFAVKSFGTVPPFLLSVLSVSAAIAGGGALLVMGDPASRWRPRDLGTRVREWLWRSAGGDWMSRLAGWRLTRTPDISALGDRPTEVAIGIAAEQLFAALPRETRDQLGDVPSVLRRLEADATKVRAALLAIERSAGGEGAAAPASSDPAPLRARLQSVVAALEAVRLDLLRLTAGIGTVESVTTAVHAALRIGDAADRLVSAHDEADGIARGLDM